MKTKLKDVCCTFICKFALGLPESKFDEPTDFWVISAATLPLFHKTSFHASIQILMFAKIIFKFGLARHGIEATSPSQVQTNKILKTTELQENLNNSIQNVLF